MSGNIVVYVDSVQHVLVSEALPGPPGPPGDGGVQTGIDANKGTPTNDGELYWATDTDRLYIGEGGNWLVIPQRIDGGIY